MLFFSVAPFPDLVEMRVPETVSRRHRTSPFMTSSSASSSKHVASWRHNVFLTTGSTAAMVSDLIGVLCRESLGARRKSGVAVVDGTFPVSIGRRQDGDEGDGGLAQRERVRGPLTDTEATLLLCPLPSTLDRIRRGISRHRRRLDSAAVASTVAVSSCSALSCNTMTTESSPASTSSSSLTVHSSRNVLVHSVGSHLTSSLR